MNSKESLYCSTCSKEFKRKVCFDKHISICSVLHNKNDDFIPSNRDIYTLVMDLNKKYDVLEKKYTLLQNKYNQLTVKNKVTPIDYLNKNINCLINFDDWLQSITISRVEIEYIIKNNFINSICFIINNFIESCNANCIQCFEDKKETLYVFNKNWLILSNPILKNLISIIRRKIFIAFKSFVDENKEKLYDESFSTIYADTIKKITDEKSKENTIIKNKLYADFENKLNML